MAYDRSLKIANPPVEDREKTYLTSRGAAAATSSTVANNNGYAANDILIIGVPGEEKTEAVIITSVSGNSTINHGATKFSHPVNTPLFRSKWNQLDVEKSTNNGSSYSNITGNPHAIDWDNPDGMTHIDISTGFSPSDVYRWQFINSASGDVSGYADTLAGTGLARNSVGYAIKMIKQNPTARNIANEVIVEYFNDLHDEEFENNPEAWYLQKKGTPIPTVADQNEYDIPSDFGRMKYLFYHYTSGDVEETYPLNFISEIEMRNRKIDHNETSDDNARDWSIYPPDDDSERGYLVIDPTPESDDQELIPIYFQELDAVDSFGDTLVIPKIKIYVDYALYRIYEDIEDDVSANKYEARVRRDLTGLKSRQHRQVGQKEFMKFRGQKGAKRLFQQSRGTGQEERENYW